MDEVDWIDILKLRVGYGQTSNQAVDPYKTWGRLATRPYNFGPTGYVTGYYVSELPNAELGGIFFYMELRSGLHLAERTPVRYI